MKKKSIAMLLVTVLALGGMAAGCGSTEEGKEEKEAGTTTVTAVYYDYADMKVAEAGEYSVPMERDTTLTIIGEDQYMLTEKMSMDISGPSSGYLEGVGYMKVAFGSCTYENEDGESTYVLSDPTRVIMSDYTMSGPNETTEIYVDTEDPDTYENYSPSDITGESAEDACKILWSTKYNGEKEDYDFSTSYVVNASTYMIEDIY